MQSDSAADEADVEGFLAFSLSVQNRQKARAGQAPRRLHNTYRLTQQAWLMDVAGFIAVVRSRQDP